MPYYKKYDPAVAARKKRNAEIFRETLSIIGKGFYTAPSGKTVTLPSLTPMLLGSECFHRELPPSEGVPLPGGTTVMVEKGDCLEVAGRLVREGYNVALLNFASAGHPGGGVETGARAQEETICRRSTLARSIYTFSPSYASKYGFEEHRGEGYPLKNLRYSVIYSPSVTVFREGIECTLMEEPFQVGVITCAALNLGGKYDLRLTPDGHMPEEAVDITRCKVRAILRIGLKFGHDSLVLGAFGCGAFRNPPREMAEIFRDVMSEKEFEGKYRLITFAIIEDHNSLNSNYGAFREVLAK